MSSPQTPVSAAPETPGVEAHVQRGLRWATTRQVLAVLASTLGAIVYSRYLQPADLGLARLAAIVYSGLFFLVQAPMSAAVIYFRDPEGEHDNAAFWLLAGFAAPAVALVLLLAGPLAALYAAPAAAALIRGVAMAFAAQAFAVVPAALLLKRFRFASYEILQIATIVVQLAGWIALSRAGWGPWSLVAPQIAAALLWACGVWAVARFRPRSRPGRAAVRDVLRYGRSLAGTRLLVYLTGNVDNAAVGALGTQALGLYSFGEDQSSVAATGVGNVAGGVALPALAAVHAGPDLAARTAEFRRVALDLLRLAASISAPLHAVLFVAAGIGIPLIVGAQWLGALDVYRAYLVYRLVDTLLPICDAATAAAGRPEVRLRFELVQLPLFVAAVVLGLNNGGIAGIALAAAAARAAVALVYLIAALRVMQVPGRAALRHLLPSYLAAAGAGAAMLAVETRLAGAPGALALSALAGAGLLVYLPLLFVLDQQGFRENARAMGRIAGLRRPPP